MFDIGFLELVIIGVVGLLVIGPERLPGAVRTASLWIARIRRSFNDIKQEVQQEIHNDAVMQELRETGKQLQEQTDGISQDIRNAGRAMAGLNKAEDHPAQPDVMEEPALPPAASDTVQAVTTDGPVIKESKPGKDAE